MYVKKSIASVVALAVLAGGYLAGAYIGFPISGNSLEGNIGKAKAFNQPNSPEVEASMEQLVNDTAMQKQTVLATAILKSRMDDVNALMASQDSVGNMSAEMKDVVKSIGLSADNAQKSLDEYLNALTAVVKGEKVENFEQTANNALLAYTIVEKKMKASSPQMVSALMETAEKNSDEKVAKLAARWIEYNAEDAYLNNSEAEMKYWQSQADVIAKNPVLSKMLNPSILFGFGKDFSSLSKSLLAVTPSKTLEKMLRSNSITLLNQDNILGIVGGGTMDKRVDIVGLSFSPIMSLIITSNAAILQQKPSPY